MQRQKIVAEEEHKEEEARSVDTSSKDHTIKALAYGSEGFLNFFDALFNQFQEKEKAQMNYYC